MKQTSIPNKLIHEKSPYLLQHAYNLVSWYPWGEEAFEKARRENKPVFLSIGYSTCHWCHVMAHESFENNEVAAILNRYFISIKVDKEERPDIDSVYMNICQALTGGGGWPTTIFMTPTQQPFFAGTYFPKQSQYGKMGFIDLIDNIREEWNKNKDKLTLAGNEITQLLSKENSRKTDASMVLIYRSVVLLKKSFDKLNGGFGYAPKFPSPHNLIFLMYYYEKTGDKETMEIAKKTLLQMYRGGIFDHIGFGFSRYSTDAYFLIPHFEKMLYDNALLMISYIRAFQITKNELYKNIAEKTAEYVLRELTHPLGGFYCAQDADSDGVEGKYYALSYDEILDLLGGERGREFNDYYSITREGNFEGKNIPNLLEQTQLHSEFEMYLPQIYEYRKSRTKLHLDDKILTSWNALMISAFATMYRVLGEKEYLEAAKKACEFIDTNLSEKDTLFVSYREGKVSGKGFLDDYAFYIFALTNMYEVTFDPGYLERAIQLTHVVNENFFDKENGGFYLYGKHNEKLILKPKETYDGAIPSGNSVMTYNLVKLSLVTKDEKLEKMAQEQIVFMAGYAEQNPAGYCFYLMSLLMSLQPAKDVICVLKDYDKKKMINVFGLDTNITILEEETKEYKRIQGKDTFYICKNKSCLPPTNDLEEASGYTRD
ncbi:hypothetical protein C8E03_105223 [Lachnotalea glycerini]|uniref:Spermatogenesis-associated protein 20-like TRX domain-containing protein n=1 Tax=Lachnotalea glycerini TaxID=1763509 RepID=A0A318EM34_9FIRM|nr:thioredoxin domain-containing protein [Lachnotalea glycerini]PXV90313.1 hypothetical protein C8E03_105223 [Lachnotalea glycerini]